MPRYGWHNKLHVTVQIALTRQNLSSLPRTWRQTLTRDQCGSYPRSDQTNSKKWNGCSLPCRCGQTWAMLQWPCQRRQRVKLPKNCAVVNCNQKTKCQTRDDLRSYYVAIIVSLMSAWVRPWWWPALTGHQLVSGHVQLVAWKPTGFRHLVLKVSRINVLVQSFRFQHLNRQVYCLTNRASSGVSKGKVGEGLLGEAPSLACGDFFAFTVSTTRNLVSWFSVKSFIMSDVRF